MSKPPATRRCTFTTKAGRPCQAWSVHGTDPPTCASHAKLTIGAGAPLGNTNRLDHGFYSRQYTHQEMADLVTLSDNAGLDDEIASIRIATRRVMAHLKEELDPWRFERLTKLVYGGAITIARLLRTRQMLGQDQLGPFDRIIAGVLDDISSDLEVNL